MDNLTDAVSNTLRTIDSRHAAIHDGRHFVASDIALAVALSATVVYVVSTDGHPQHFNWEVNSDGGVKVDIYEGVTTTNDGTALTAFNRDRTKQATHVATMSAYKTPTGLSGGTLLFSTGSTSKSGGLQVSSQEFIFKPNTKYSFILTAYTNNVNIATMFDWYELGY